MQEHMSNVNREMKTRKKESKEMIEIKNTVTEMKNSFDDLISSLDTDKKRISKIEAMSIETLQTKYKLKNEWRGLPWWCSG